MSKGMLTREERTRTFETVKDMLMAVTMLSDHKSDDASLLQSAERLVWDSAVCAAVNEMIRVAGEHGISIGLGPTEEK